MLRFLSSLSGNNYLCYQQTNKRYYCLARFFLPDNNDKISNFR